MKINYRLCCLLTASILTSYSSGLVAQPEQITGTFSADFSRVILGKKSLQILKTYDLDQNQLKIIVGEVQSYQEQYGEVLGIEIVAKPNRAPTLIARPDLGPLKFSISKNSLMELEQVYGLSTNFDGPSLTASLAKELAGQGAHSKAVEDILPGSREILNTVNPLDGSVTFTDIEKLLENLCSTASGSCNIGNVVVDVTELPRLVTGKQSSSYEDQSDYKDLSRCKASRDAFQKIYKTKKSRSNVVKIAVNPKIWLAAAEYDSNCLEAVTNPNSRLEHFAIIKQPTDTDPWCGAFRIGPRQFVSAMHCFLNNRGKVDLEKSNQFSIYLLSKPDNPITFSISAASIQNFKERYPNGVKDPSRLPAIRDFVVLDSALIDNRTDNDFRNIVSKPVIGRNAYLPGYFHYHSERRSKPNDWTAGLRFTKDSGSSYCRLYDVVELPEGPGCLIHRCQAIAGYSGSPLMQETSDGKLTLVGVHVRGAGNFGKHCPGVFSMDKGSGGSGKTPITNFANIATMVSIKLLKQSGWKLGTNNDKH